jgi:hypothetical protein
LELEKKGNSFNISYISDAFKLFQKEARISKLFEGAIECDK